MSITGIFLFLIFLILFILAGVFFFHSATKQVYVDGESPPKLSQAQMQQNLASNAYLPKPAWGAFAPSSTQIGQCLAYSVVASQFVPVPPSYADLNAGKTSGYIYSNQTCLDPDQIFAQAGTRTCTANNSGAAGSGCYLTVLTNVNGADKFPGEKVEVGVTEGTNGTLYSPCNYPNNGTAVAPGNSSSSFCGGSLGLLVPNFTPLSSIQEAESLCSNVKTQNFCVSIDPDNSPTPNKIYMTKLAACDLGQFYQLFRMTRYSIDSQFNLVQDDKGNLASIIFRENGYYLAPKLPIDLNTGEYKYDFLEINSSLSTAAGMDTVDLVLLNPGADTSRNGVYWLLQNQYSDPQYDLSSIPPQQYYGCNIGTVSQANAIKGCSIEGVPTFYNPANSTFSPVSPQQLVYIPDLYQMPTDSVTDPTGYWTYLTNQFSINQFNNLPVLQPFRQKIPVTVDNNGTTINKYANGVFPIRSTDNTIYTDTQFLSYTNMPNAILAGVSTISPGCSPVVSGNSFTNNLYNPFVASNSPILFTSANN